MINGCTSTQIYCRPNCPPGRRTKPQKRVTFESREAARSAGFRACKVCAPDDGRDGPWVSKRAAAQLAAIGSMDAKRLSGPRTTAMNSAGRFVS